MKKLIALIVLFGIGVTQAASINWSITSVYSPNGDGTPSASKCSGGIAYIFVDDGSSITPTLATAALAGGASAWATFSGSAVNSALTTGLGGITQNGVGSGFAASTAYSLFVVVLNAGTYAGSTFEMVSIDKTVTMPGSGSGAWAYGSPATGGYLPNNWTAIPVPEPTSMALFALGGVAMSFRRKFQKKA